MDVVYPGFGSIEVCGTRYGHDVVVAGGDVRARDKGPSRSRKAEFGHTPLTAAEDLPWGGGRLVIGTGAAGSLPVTRDVEEEAAERGIELVMVPTAEACRLLADVDPADVYAVLHVTC